MTTKPITHPAAGLAGDSQSPGSPGERHSRQRQPVRLAGVPAGVRAERQMSGASDSAMRPRSSPAPAGRAARWPRFRWIVAICRPVSAESLSAVRGQLSRGDDAWAAVDANAGPLAAYAWPEARASFIPSWKSLMKWISLKDAWHQLRHEESGHTMFATGLARACSSPICRSTEHKRSCPFMHRSGCIFIPRR